VVLSVPNWGSEFVTICGDRQQVVGLMRAHYVCRIPPPGKLQNLLRAIGIDSFAWRLRRRFRKRLLREHPKGRKVVQRAIG
jgi:hypothetical protein